MSRRILHADLDAFYASVEQRDDPALRGRPVVVGGGVVLAASYEARAHGVRSAMGGRERARRCPQAVVTPVRWEAYTEASRAVFGVLEGLVPRVDRVSIDEAFLDVSGIEEPVRVIGERLRRAVREEVDLPISVGAASTKALAKVASAAAKPDGLLVVPPGTEEAFLAPLAVDRLWGVGPATARKLRAHGLERVGQLAALEETQLMQLLGVAAGRHLHAVAHGREPRPMVARRRRRSFGAQSAGRRSSPEEVDAVLVRLAGRVTDRMRAKGRVGRTVVLRLRFGDFTKATRSRTLVRATNDPAPVVATLRALLAEADELVVRRGLTLVGVALTGVEEEGGEQLALPLEPLSAPAARSGGP